MKLAAAESLAALAKASVPDWIYDMYSYPSGHLKFGPEYIIPKPFDPRLIEYLPMAVAKAAMESGSATKKIEDFDKYRESLKKRTTSFS